MAPTPLRYLGGQARSLLRTARRIRAKLLSETTRFYRYYIARSAFTYTIERTATVESPVGVAIVALFPRGPILPSATRLISTLAQERYLVVAVVNESPDSRAWISALTKQNITLLSRPNVGRDFGAYKVGYLFAEKSGLLANARHLVFANDSVFYGPRSEAFLHDLLTDEQPWLAMFVSREMRLHAQSFFIRFDREHIAHPQFRRFWHNFYSSEERGHTINKGEIRLSTVLTDVGFTPHAFVTADRILSNPAFGDFTENERFNILRFSGKGDLAPESISRHEIEAIMRAQYASVNISHAQGTLAARVLGAPVKFFFDPRYVPETELRNTLLALGCAPEELHEVLAYMRTSTLRT